jgi:hypothetical protein
MALGCDRVGFLCQKARPHSSGFSRAWRGIRRCSFSVEGMETVEADHAKADQVRMARDGVTP